MSIEKLHATLAESLEAAAPDQGIRIIVKYRADIPREAISVRAVPAGGQVKHHYRRIPARAMTLRAGDIAAYAEGDEVERIWPDLAVHTWLDASVPLLEAPRVWADSGRGAGVKVAIVDTGIDTVHLDFAGRIQATRDFSGKGSVTDGHGHGTHVASIAAGSGAASGGRYVGVASQALLYVAKVLADDGGGLMSDVMAGIEWAVDEGAQVINLSLGSAGPGDGDDALSVLCDAAVGEGVVVCAAAGNSGPGASTVGPPGVARLVITVGASDKSDGIASFSSRGPTSDGRVKPDIVFPGVDIAAARAAGTSMGTPVDGSYTLASGTSMATPHATGAVALLLEAYPNLTPAEVKDVLMRSAKDLGLNRNTQGAGRSQVYNAYASLKPAQPPTPEPPEPPPPTEPPEPPIEPPPPREGCLTRVMRALGLAK
jgi:subtilisin family serine protease